MRKNDHIGERRFMTVPQLAKRWGVSLAHAYRLVERGTVPSLRAGTAIRVPIAAVERIESSADDAA